MQKRQPHHSSVKNIYLAYRFTTSCYANANSTKATEAKIYTGTFWYLGHYYAMVVTTTGSKGKFRCLKEGSSCRDVKAVEVWGFFVFQRIWVWRISTGSTKSIDSPGRARFYTQLPASKDGQAKLCPNLSQRTGGARHPFPLSLASSWGSRAENSKDLSPGQTWHPLPVQTLPVLGRGMCCQQTEGLRGAGTAPHGILSNKRGEKPQT